MLLISSSSSGRSSNSTCSKLSCRRLCHASPLPKHRNHQFHQHPNSKANRRSSSQQEKTETHCPGTTIFAAVSRMVTPNLQTTPNQSIDPLRSNRKTTNPKMSAALLYLPCRTSGAMYSLSPSRSNPSPANLGQTDAIPKSPIFSLPSAVTKMFAGFRSRWRISLSWMNIMPCLRHNTRVT